MLHPPKQNSPNNEQTGLGGALENKGNAMVHGLKTLMRINEAASRTHTQGPWRAGKGYCVVADYPIPEIGGSDASDYYGGHLICESIAPRNIPIVAAAPELLHQLECALEFIGRCSDWRGDDPQVDEIRKVISKAKGQCPT